MKKKLLFCFIIFLAAAFLIPFAHSGSRKGFNTLVIMPLENLSMTVSKQGKRVGLQISTMLMTEMFNVRSNFSLVNRRDMKAILQEIEFNKTLYVDKSKAVNAGKLFGVHYMGFGSFMINNGKMRIDVRITHVETGSIINAVYVKGDSNNYSRLVHELAGKIAKTSRIATKSRY